MKKILFSLFLMFITLGLQAQNSFWEEANSPYGGDAKVTRTNSNIVYAQCAYAIYRSQDFGTNWIRIFVEDVDTLDNTGEVLTIGSSGIFYKVVFYFNGSATYERKLFISNNEGQTWSLLANTPNNIHWITETPSGALLGISSDETIFRSTDNGLNWSTVFISTLQNSLINVQSRTTSDGKILLSSLYGNDFAYSEDDGLNWVEGESPRYQSSSYLAASGTILALDKTDLSIHPDLFRSTNGGITWDTIVLNNVTGDISENNITNLNSGKLLLSTSKNLYISTDDGMNWTVLPSSPEHATSFALNAPLANGTILGLQKECLVRSDDNGESWSFSAFGMKSATISMLKTISEQEQLTLTSSGLWRTLNRGKTWNRLITDTSDISFYTQKPVAVMNRDSFAVNLGLKIWATTDTGQSFNEITPAVGLKLARILAAPSGYLFCTTPNGVMKWNGLGNNWSLSIADQGLLELEEHPTGNLYALTNLINDSTVNYRLMRSQDKGETWEEITNLAAGSEDRYDLEVGKDGKLYVYVFQGQAVKIAISEDEAETWEFKTIPEYSTIGNLLINDAGQIFIVNFLTNKVITSVDSGDSWYYLPDVPYAVSFQIENIISPDGYLYLPTFEGLLLRTRNPTQFGAFVRGKISRDADMDCSTPDAIEPLKNWKIALEGENTYYAITNELGRYTFFVDTGNYIAKAIIPQNLWWSLCDSTHVITANDMMNSNTADFIALPLADCPLMSVDIAIPKLRRCFENNVFVSYCNQGTETADSAWVDVMLDPYLSFINSAQPYILLPDNIIRFFTGDIISGDCGQFQFIVYVNCDSTVIGQTHCITAHGFPDSLCVPVPNWSGANIQADVTCQDSTLQFNLKNTGSAHSQLLEYIIIEDDVVLITGQQDYDVAEDLVLNVAANGKTWRIESEQEPGHPFSNLALAFAEGCGGFNSLGFINQFPVNGITPSWHRVCVENQGAFDPNDKQGFPLGIGTEHNIRPGQALDYLIRFQNTGTDTAFTVVIRDTLSPFLDPASIRPGASSHSYTWNLSGQGIISFTFSNIMLPDSNINEAGSHGFIQFNIAPYADIPLGSTIENDAAIYFDFNEPVITNTTWHTIQKSPLTSSLNPEPETASKGLEIWPNPCIERTHFHVPQKTSGALQLNIYDSRGTLVAQKKFTGPDLEFNARSLPAGLYWTEMRDIQGRLVGHGKLIKE